MDFKYLNGGLMLSRSEETEAEDAATRLDTDPAIWCIWQDRSAGFSVV